MFAGAAFTDSADIKVDADVVDTLVSLGIVEGFEDGSFQPNGTVTRAQMAKMIYVLRTGNSDASAYNDEKSSFTDINGHWARGYIKYCQSLGIIAGKSNTKFVPNEKVSAQEAAKMLLVTLGYNAQKAGLVGTGWASKTNALADENGLLEDVNTSFTSACPRQYAAQLIYNAIDTPTVVWRDDAYTNTNYRDGDNKTIGEKYMGLHSVEGILTSFAKEDGKDTYGATVSSITKQDGSKTVTLTGAKEDFTKIAKDYVALKNNKVKVLYKDTDEVYGVFALTDSNKVISGLLGDFGTSSDKLKLNGTKYTVDTKGNATTNLVQVDGTAVTGTYKNDLVGYVKNSVNGLAKAYDASAISNSDNNKINLLDIKAFDVAQVTYVGKDYINVSYKTNTVSPAFSSKLKDDDAVWYDGIAKDDYVAVTAKANTSADKIGVTKLDTVTGKITSTKKDITTDDDYQIQINGTWYETATKAADRADLKLDATVTVVVKQGYVLYCDDATAGANDVAAVLQTYKEGNTWKAELLFADGKTETVSLKRNAEWDDDADDVYDDAVPTIDAYQTSGAAQLVAYTKSGDSYKLQSIKNNTVNPTSYNDVSVVASGNTVKNNRMTSGDTKYINDNAVVFVRYKSGSEYKFSVQTGKSMKGWSNSKTFASTTLGDKSNGVLYAKVVLADMGAHGLPGGSDTTYAYIFSNNRTVGSDGTKYITYDAWNGEETVSLKVEEDTASAKQGNVVKYTVDANGIATFDQVYTLAQKGVVLNGTFNGAKVEGSAAVAPATGATIAKTAAEATNYNIDISYDDDESYVFFVDTSEDSSDGNARKTSEQTNWTTPQENGANYVTNVAYYVANNNYGADSADQLVLMVVDTDNELETSLFH